MSDVQPVRLQRSRRKGARLVSPNGLPVVCCTRPGKWGNPFYVTGNIGIVVSDQYAVETREFAVSMFGRYLREGKLDFTEADRFGWYRWTSKHGWASYTWLPASEAEAKSA